LKNNRIAEKRNTGDFGYFSSPSLQGKDAKGRSSNDRKNWPNDQMAD
jgi:hypothetical protein